MKLKIYLLIAGLVFFSFPGIGQEADPSLNGKFEDLTGRSETYQDYKVIKRELLSQFWNEVNDTLHQNRKENAALASELKSVKSDMIGLQAELKTAQTSLEQVTLEKESMSLLGADLKKTHYSILVWTIIAVLAFLVGAVQMRFVNANRISGKIRKENQKLEAEFEEFRKKAREKEIKLKRELQTEINTVEELKQKVTLKG